MATKKSSSKKSTKKAAKKAPKKTTKEASKKASKKSVKRSALTTSPTDPSELVPIPPSLRCIEACAAAYSRCLAGGGNPQRCMKVFVSCLRGCFRVGGVGGVGGVGEVLGE